MNVLALNACTHFTGFVPFSTVDCGDIEAVHFSSEAPAKEELLHGSFQICNPLQEETSVHRTSDERPPSVDINPGASRNCQSQEVKVKSVSSS